MGGAVRLRRLIALAVVIGATAAAVAQAGVCTCGEVMETILALVRQLIEGTRNALGRLQGPVGGPGVTPAILRSPYRGASS